MTYVVRDTEAGNVIESFSTEEQAISAMEAYEEQDKQEGVYEAGFYEVAEIE